MFNSMSRTVSLRPLGLRPSLRGGGFISQTEADALTTGERVRKRVCVFVYAKVRASRYSGSQGCGRATVSAANVTYNETLR